MQIQSIRNVSFKGAEASDNKKTENKQQKAKHDNFYTLLSKDLAYEARRMSEGREEQDGKLKLAEGTAAFASVGMLSAALIKDFKALKLTKKAKGLLKKSASSEKANELKAAAKQKLKGAKGFLAAGIALFAASRAILFYNKYDAKKTTKERGFMTDDELELMFLTKKVESQNNKNTIEKPEDKSEAETKKEQ